MFFDEAKVHVKAGRGGDGCVAFRREWGVPRGGPAGGNGGKGGDVYLRAAGRLSTLIAFERQTFLSAEHGQRGRGKTLYGHNGQDLVVEVPVGTVIRDAETGLVLGDLVQDEQQICVARGGRGGRGNAAFATPTNQAPRLSEKGEPGEERWLLLELKLIADVGIVGMPNAGKSTLLAAVSAARPKIAPYPFTTLQPNLGVVSLDWQTSFVMADLPGLIKGASQGAGLGHRFLRHVERTRLLVHLLDGLANDPVQNYEVINQELAAFSERLTAKPQVVVLNKIDVPAAREAWAGARPILARQGVDLHGVSAASGEGVQDLLAVLARRLAEIPTEVVVEEPDVVPQVDEKAFTIRRGARGWRVQGIAIERAAIMTNWDQYESVARFQRILEAMGITMALREAGVTDDDTVFVGDTELRWGWEEE